MSKSIIDLDALQKFRQLYDKRLKDGVIVPSKSLQAQSIQAVSVESGAVQDTPFINQGTGTANGADIVDTSPVGKHLEKQGNTVVVNQGCVNSNFETNSGYEVLEPTYLDGSVSNNKLTLTVLQNFSSGVNVNITSYQLIATHRYLIMATIKSVVGNNTIALKTANGGSQTGETINEGQTKQLYVIVQDVAPVYSTFRLRFVGPATTGQQVKISKLYIIDLTQWFNGDIPQDLLDHPENFFRYYNGSFAYNEGSLENSDGQYLECGGRNVWDEVTESGKIDYITGQETSDSDRIRGKNIIKVIPNATYYCKSPASAVYIYAYDKNNNYLGAWSSDGWIKNGIENVSNKQFTIPPTCDYLRIGFSPSYGNVYHNDTTISLYYETGDGYDQYYPYEQPKVYDTGNEVLRKARKVKDIKLRTGIIQRKVGIKNINELSLTAASYESINYFVTGDFRATIKNPSAGLQNTIADKFINVSNSLGVAGLTANVTYLIYTDGYVYFRDDTCATVTDFKAKYGNANVLYELATETTEQGTPFSDVIEINDYGTMAWKDSNNEYVEIPQGCKIFYPADYVLFIDSLGQREDIKWDATKLVSESQLGEVDTAYKAVDTQLKNALGGTLRQLLASSKNIDFLNTAFIDLGTLDYSKSASGLFSSNQLEGIIKGVSTGSQVGNLISSSYKAIDYSSISGPQGASPSPDMVMAVNGTGVVAFNNLSYTDTAAFKAAMKGVLLAYEKAS